MHMGVDYNIIMFDQEHTTFVHHQKAEVAIFVINLGTDTLG